MFKFNLCQSFFTLAKHFEFMSTIRISAISYLNTAPFAYGLRHSPISKSIELLYGYPLECAQRLKNGEVDVSLLPVGSLPNFSSYNFISDYCIGAEGKVRTVALVTNSPLNQVKKIYLDYQSRTSVLLIKILCREKWGIQPEFINLKPEQNYLTLMDGEAAVLIGDKVFRAEKIFKHIYDLSNEWYQAYGLPFVFAVWVSIRRFPDDFIAEFNKALQLGISSIPQAIEEFQNLSISKEESLEYLQKNISFKLDEQKFKAVEKFLSLIKSLP